MNSSSYTEEIPERKLKGLHLNNLIMQNKISKSIKYEYLFFKEDFNPFSQSLKENINDFCENIDKLKKQYEWNKKFGFVNFNLDYRGIKISWKNEFYNFRYDGKLNIEKDYIGFNFKFLGN